jgi:hypothetical protein
MSSRLHLRLPRLKYQYLCAVMLSVMIIASCSAPPTAGNCYRYEFFNHRHNGSGDLINIISGDWIYPIGLITTEGGDLQVNWEENFIVEVYAISVAIRRPEGVTGDISIQLIADVFGYDLRVNETLPSQLNEAEVYWDTLANPSTKIFNAAVQTSGQLIVEQMTVFLSGPNPFPINHCGPATATPDESQTPLPTATPHITSTATPEESPTGTPTPVGTPTPPTQFYCLEWNFSQGVEGFGNFVYPGMGNFTNQWIGEFDGDEWVDTFSDKSAKRGVAVGKGWVQGGAVGTFTVNRIQIEYVAVFGGDTHDESDAFPIALYYRRASDGVWVQSAVAEWSDEYVTFDYPLWPSSINIRGIRFFGVSSVDRQYESNVYENTIDHGGEIRVRKVRIYFDNPRSGTPPLSGDWCDLLPTPTPTFTPPGDTATPTNTAPPTATPTRTPFFSTPFTATATSLIVASRTAIPPTSTPAPTNTIVFPTLPQPTGTDTRTPKPSTTPPPTGTFIPHPTEIDGSVTPWGTYEGPALTPLPGTPDFEGIGTPVIGTLVGTPQVGDTAIPVPDDLSDLHPGIEGGLGTAVAYVNGLPQNIGVVMPDAENLSQFAGQAKWIISGVSLQEIFGRKVYPIPLHMFYGLTVVLFVSSVMLIFRFVLWFIKLAVWVIRFILKIIPFIG